MLTMTLMAVQGVPKKGKNRFCLMSQQPSIRFLNNFFSWKLRSIHKFWKQNRYICNFDIIAPPMTLAKQFLNRIQRIHSDYFHHISAIYLPNVTYISPPRKWGPLLISKWSIFWIVAFFIFVNDHTLPNFLNFLHFLGLFFIALLW